MGYGLNVNVPVLVNRAAGFNVVLDHYRAFDLETGPATGMDLYVYNADRLRFGTFLELVQNLDAANCDTALVVNHGKSDDSGSPLGLSLPLSAHAASLFPEQNVLEALTHFIGYIPDDDECAAAEKKFNQFVSPMPAGTLKPLATALQNLRVKRRLRRLELRACNLGGNQEVMKLLGMVLGVQAVVAPKVHMFYMGVTLRPLPDSAAAFADWQSKHPRARIFNGPTGSLGIEVIGTSVQRSMDFHTTTLDVKWFIDKYICPGNNYVSTLPGKHARVAPFTFAGMDVGNPPSFALGQEDAYEAQLVEVAVPRVATTMTVVTK